MEEDIRKETSSPSSLTKRKERIEERLKEAIELAEQRQAYESAHDEEILRALTVVADFIRRKRRVCYGGTAMNAILPAAKRFYDPEYDLPDYDFYTPDVNGDVAALVKDLKDAGFQDVYHRVGIHEGTKKILVNFIAVADITAIEPELFEAIARRAIVKGGIRYTDPDILRMMMYLELSRPKGDVGRWEKVFERLLLINEFFPYGVGGGRSKRGTRRSTRRRCAARTGPALPPAVQKMLLNYIIENQRVLCNGPLVALYERGISKGDIVFDGGRPLGPLLFTSPEPKEDARRLKAALERLGTDDGGAAVKVYLHKARGELVPTRYELRNENTGAAFCTILEEVACHAYNPVPFKGGQGRAIAVASLEFLLTLYLSLDIFTRHSEAILGPGAKCSIRRFLELSLQNYTATGSQFPAFPLTCQGHQTGYVSLLRAKVERIQREKGGVGAGTRRRSRSRSRSSRSRSSR